MQKWLKVLPLLVGLLMIYGFRTAVTAAPTGFLVLAPDRGFLGNEEIRDLFSAFQADVPDAVLAFATAERTEENLREALAKLAQGSTDLREVVVLPLFLSEHMYLYQNAYAVLQSIKQPAIRFAQPLGKSYLAEEILFDRVAALAPEPQKMGNMQGMAGMGAHPDGREHGGHGQGHLVLLASGAGTAEAEAAIKADLEPLMQHAVKKFGLHGGDVAVLYDWSAPDSAASSAFDRSIATIQAATEHGPVLVVPFNLGPLLTNMMSDWARIQHSLMQVNGAVYDGQGVVPHPNVLRWLTRTANGYLPLAQNEVGVIFVPHGSDYNWNEAMRDALAPLRERYVTEDAFSMVDPEVVERAVRKLEDKGMKAAVLVRIFSLESSFRDQAEYMLGLRPDFTGGHHGSVERIRSSLRFATVGGMEANPYLAQAMLDRAKEISRNPSKETVILVGHGTGGDAENAHWLDNMAKLAAYIKQHGGENYRDVRYFTWREDWPSKREAAVKEIRAAVEKASQDGGTALVIPVRTIGEGPEATYLAGLEYRQGTGFAPHPAFVQWIASLIQEGMAALRRPEADLVLGN